LRTDGADLTAMRMLRKVLASGEAIILFPEGGISLDGRPKTFHPGIISLAAAAQAPLVPVAIRGAFEAFPRWRRIPRPGRVTVVFGNPLPPPPRGDRAMQTQLAEALMRAVGDLLDGRRGSSPPW
jgi:1-acyl-sn-glycerol-3-phosphate acyltransferase